MRAEDGHQFAQFPFFNRWDVDVAFRAAVVRHLAQGSISRAETARLVDNLRSFGGRICDGEWRECPQHARPTAHSTRCADYEAIGATFDSRSEPYLVQYDAWGRRIDKLVTSSGWKQFKAIAAQEAIVGESYSHNAAATSGGGRAQLGAW